jgi:uncharacterized protein (TIGR04255 family)
MNGEAPLPRFRKPPVSEVALGVQFSPILNPVHLGLYYLKVRSGFPKIQVQPPILPAFETFGTSGTGLTMGLPTFGGGAVVGPRMWFMSDDDNLLIQLQSDRLLFNWRGGVQGSAYPHFDAVQTQFMNALGTLETLVDAEKMSIVVNQCEVVYINPILTSQTGVSPSDPQKIFRVWSAERGPEWPEPIEDLSLNARYRLKDEAGNPFGRLTVAVASGLAADESTAFQLELTARGLPQGVGREGIAAFHNQGHRAIVRCFAAITTPEMHRLWERYQ